MAVALTTRRVKKKIEQVVPGKDTIDLDPWFQSVYSMGWIEKIAHAYEQYSEDYWHDEDNPNCDDDEECKCPAPDKGLVSAGIVYNHIVNEYVEIESITVYEGQSRVDVQIDFEDDDVPVSLTKFAIELGTVVETNEFEEVPVHQVENQGKSGPLQPPKDFMKGLVVESKGPDLPKYPALRQEIF